MITEQLYVLVLFYHNQVIHYIYFYSYQNQMLNTAKCLKMVRPWNNRQSRWRRLKYPISWVWLSILSSQLAIYFIESTMPCSNAASIWPTWPHQFAMITYCHNKGQVLYLKWTEYNIELTLLELNILLTAVKMLKVYCGRLQ